MATAKRPPTPREARELAGLSPVELAAKARCSLALVYSCEKRGTYPTHRALRAAYLRALHQKEG